MTAGNQIDHLGVGSHQPYRTSLRRFVAEKWGADVEDDVSDDESESESVAGHFRAALSNAASKLRFPLRHKEKASGAGRTVDSDEETDDGRSLIAAFSKTANTISATLRRGKDMIKTPLQRSAAEQPFEDSSNHRCMIGTEISGSPSKLLQDGGGNDSSTSSLDSSNHDPIEHTLPKENVKDETDHEVAISSHGHSAHHRRRRVKSKTTTTGAHSEKPKRTTRTKSSSLGEKQEKPDEQGKEACPDQNFHTKDHSPKTSRRTAAPGRRGVRRTTSLNEDTKHREHREHRVTRTRHATEHKGTHHEHTGEERRRGVHRTVSLHGQDKVRESADHRATRSTVTTEKTSTPKGSNNDEKRRGVQRATSHDLAHMRKHAEKITA